MSLSPSDLAMVRWRAGNPEAAAAELARLAGLPAEAEAAIAELLATTRRAALDEGKEQGRTSGYDEGYSDGKVDGEGDAEELEEEIREDLKRTACRRWLVASEEERHL